MSRWLSKYKIIIHLKPDQTEALTKRTDKGGWPQKGLQALYIEHPINLHGGDFRFVNLFYSG